MFRGYLTLSDPWWDGTHAPVGWSFIGSRLNLRLVGDGSHAPGKAWQAPGNGKRAGGIASHRPVAHIPICLLCMLRGLGALDTSGAAPMSAYFMSGCGSSSVQRSCATVNGLPAR